MILIRHNNLLSSSGAVECAHSVNWASLRMTGLGYENQLVPWKPKDVIESTVHLGV